MFFSVTVIGPLPLRQAGAQGLLEPVSAISTLGLPPSGSLVTLSPAFQPTVIKGIKINPNNPFQFDFIVDTGDSGLRDEKLRDESTRLIKYFLTSLTVPEDDLWVNLSPYEQEKIIPNQFGITEMGRDLLAQDYLLKQVAASLIYPEDDLGRAFWEKVYHKLKTLYGPMEIPVNTFNKVWIVPEKASVFENGDTAFVVESHLKVMLEEDYEALNANAFNAQSRAALGGNDGRRGMGRDVENAVTSQILRELIIPELEKEVNQGQNFAQLRQIYHSLILATWYKRNLQESILNKVYVGKNKVDGIDLTDQQVKDKIYQQYLEAFKKGVYDYIKEEYDPVTQDIVPRKYFSGGMTFVGKMSLDHAMTVPTDQLHTKNRFIVRSGIEAVDHGQVQDLIYLQSALPEKTGDLTRDGRGRSKMAGARRHGHTINDLQQQEAWFIEQARLVGRDDQYGVGAKVVVVSEDIMGRNGGYYFPHEGQWYIVINGSLDKEIQELSEWQEAAEISFIKKGYNFQEEQRHRLAAALQRQTFADQGFTSFDDLALDWDLTEDDANRLYLLAIEDRGDQHKLFALAQQWAIGFQDVKIDREKILDYERRFRLKAVLSAFYAYQSILRKEIVDAKLLSMKSMLTKLSDMVDREAYILFESSIKAQIHQMEARVDALKASVEQTRQALSERVRDVNREEIITAAMESELSTFNITFLEDEVMVGFDEDKILDRVEAAYLKLLNLKWIKDLEEIQDEYFNAIEQLFSGKFGALNKTNVFNDIKATETQIINEAQIRVNPFLERLGREPAKQQSRLEGEDFLEGSEVASDAFAISVAPDAYLAYLKRTNSPKVPQIEAHINQTMKSPFLIRTYQRLFYEPQDVRGLFKIIGKRPEEVSHYGENETSGFERSAVKATRGIVDTALPASDAAMVASAKTSAGLTSREQRLIQNQNQLPDFEKLKPMYELYNTASGNWVAMLSTLKVYDKVMTYAADMAMAGKIKEFPRDLFERIRALLKQNDGLQALIFAEKVLTKFPEDRLSWQAVILVLTETGKTLEAIETAYRAKRKFRDSDGIITSLVNNLLEVGRVGEAVQVAEEAMGLEKLQHNHYVRDSLANALIQAGRAKEAVPIVEETVRDNRGDKIAIYTLINAYIMSGQFNEAVAFIKANIQRFPGDESFLMLLAKAFMYSGQSGQAVQAALEAVRLKPDSWLAIITLVNAYIHHGQMDEAFQLLQDSIRKHPHALIFRSHLVSVYIRTGRLEEARDIAEKTMERKIFRDKIYSINALGLVDIQSGRLQDAIQRMEEAIQKTPHNWEGRNILADAFLIQGNSRKVLEVLDLNKFSELKYNPVSLLLLASAYAQLDQKEQTYRVLNEARSLFVLFPQIEEIREWLNKNQTGLKEIKRRLERLAKNAVAITLENYGIVKEENVQEASQNHPLPKNSTPENPEEITFEEFSRRIHEARSLDQLNPLRRLVGLLSKGQRKNAKALIVEKETELLTSEAEQPDRHRDTPSVKKPKLTVLQIIKAFEQGDQNALAKLRKMARNGVQEARAYLKAKSIDWDSAMLASELADGAMTDSRASAGKRLELKQHGAVVMLRNYDESKLISSLSQNGNPPLAVQKFLALVERWRQGDLKKILLEVGGGNLAAAKAYAERYPDTGVISIGLDWISKKSSGQSPVLWEYLHYLGGDIFNTENRNLLEDIAKFDNLAIAQISLDDVLSILPEAFVTDLLFLSPDLKWEYGKYPLKFKDFFDFFDNKNNVDKFDWKGGGVVAVLPFRDIEYYHNAIRKKVKFKTIGESWRGLRLFDLSPHAQFESIHGYFVQDTKVWTIDMQTIAEVYGGNKDQGQPDAAMVNEGQRMPFNLSERVGPLVNTKQFDEAVKIVQKAVRDYPLDPLAWSVAIDTLEKAGRLSEAIDLGFEALNMRWMVASNKFVRNALVMVLMRADRAWEAVPIAQQTIQMPQYKRDRYSWDILANALMEVGRARKAVHIAERNLELHPEDKIARGTLINVYIGAGRFQDAVKMAEDYIRKVSNDKVFLTLLAKAYIYNGQSDEAVKIASEAVRRNSNDWVIINTLVSAYFHNDQIQEAIDYLSKLIKKYPQTSIFRNHLVSAYLKKGELVTALSLAEESVSTLGFKNDVYALNTLGNAYIQSGKAADAIRILEETLDLYPNNVITRNILAEAYLIQGQPSKIFETLDLKTFPQLKYNPVSVILLANAHVALNDWNQAYEVLNQTRPSFTLFPQIEEILVKLNGLLTQKESVGHKEIKRSLSRLARNAVAVILDVHGFVKQEKPQEIQEITFIPPAEDETPIGYDELARRITDTDTLEQLSPLNALIALLPKDKRKEAKDMIRQKEARLLREEDDGHSFKEKKMSGKAPKKRISAVELIKAVQNGDPEALKKLEKAADNGVQEAISFLRKFSGSSYYKDSAMVIGREKFLALPVSEQMKMTREAGFFNGNPVKVLRYDQVDPIFQAIYTKLLTQAGGELGDELWVGGSDLIPLILTPDLNEGAKNVFFQKDSFEMNILWPKNSDGMQVGEVVIDGVGDNKIYINRESSISLHQMILLRSKFPNLKARDLVPRNIFLKWNLARFTKEGIDIYALDEESAEDIKNHYLRLSKQDRFNNGSMNYPAEYNLIVLYRALIQRSQYGLEPWLVERDSLVDISRGIMSFSFGELITSINRIAITSSFIERTYILDLGWKNLLDLVNFLRKNYSLTEEEFQGFDRLANTIKLIINPRLIDGFTQEEQLIYKLIFYYTSSPPVGRLAKEHGFREIRNKQEVIKLMHASKMDFYTSKGSPYITADYITNEFIEGQSVFYVNNDNNVGIFVVSSNEGLMASAATEDRAMVDEHQTGEKYKDDFADWMKRSVEEAIGKIKYLLEKKAGVDAEDIIGLFFDETLRNAFEVSFKRGREDRDPGYRPRVHIEVVLTPDGQLRLSVEDNGIGIDETSLKDLFEKPKDPVESLVTAYLYRSQERLWHNGVGGGLYIIAGEVFRHFGREARLMIETQDAGGQALMKIVKSAQGQEEGAVESEIVRGTDKQEQGTVVSVEIPAHGVDWKSADDTLLFSDSWEPGQDSAMVNDSDSRAVEDMNTDKNIHFIKPADGAMLNSQLSGFLNLYLLRFMSARLDELRGVDNISYEALSAFAFNEYKRIGRLEGAYGMAGFNIFFENNVKPGVTTSVSLDQDLVLALFPNMEMKKDLFSRQLLTAVMIKEGATVINMRRDPQYYRRIIELKEGYSADIESARMFAAHLIEGETVGFRAALAYLRGQGITAESLNARLESERNDDVRKLLTHFHNLMGATEGVFDTRIPGESQDFALKKQLVRSGYLNEFPGLFATLYPDNNINESSYLVDEKYSGRPPDISGAIRKTYAEILQGHGLNGKELEQILTAFEVYYSQFLESLAREPLKNRKQILLMNTPENREKAIENSFLLLLYVGQLMKSRFSQKNPMGIKFSSPLEREGVYIKGESIVVNVMDLIKKDILTLKQEIGQVLAEKYTDHAMTAGARLRKNIVEEYFKEKYKAAVINARALAHETLRINGLRHIDLDTAYLNPSLLNLIRKNNPQIISPLIVSLAREKRRLAERYGLETTPIIVTRFGDEMFVEDGDHRVYQARSSGEKIYAIIINVQEGHSMPMWQARQALLAAYQKDVHRGDIPLTNKIVQADDILDVMRLADVGIRSLVLSRLNELRLDVRSSLLNGARTLLTTELNAWDKETLRMLVRRLLKINDGRRGHRGGDFKRAAARTDFAMVAGGFDLAGREQELPVVGEITQLLDSPDRAPFALVGGGASGKENQLKTALFHQGKEARVFDLRSWVGQNLVDAKTRERILGDHNLRPEARDYLMNLNERITALDVQPQESLAAVAKILAQDYRSVERIGIKYVEAYLVQEQLARKDFAREYNDEFFDLPKFFNKENSLKALAESKTEVIIFENFDLGVQPEGLHDIEMETVQAMAKIMARFKDGRQVVMYIHPPAREDHRFMEVMNETLGVATADEKKQLKEVEMEFLPSEFETLALAKLGLTEPNAVEKVQSQAQGLVSFYLSFLIAGGEKKILEAFQQAGREAAQPDQLIEFLIEREIGMIKKSKPVLVDKASEDVRAVLGRLSRGEEVILDVSQNDQRELRDKLKRTMLVKAEPAGQDGMEKIFMPPIVQKALTDPAMVDSHQPATVSLIFSEDNITVRDYKLIEKLPRWPSDSHFSDNDDHDKAMLPSMKSFLKRSPYLFLGALMLGQESHVNDKEDNVSNNLKIKDSVKAGIPDSLKTRIFDFMDNRIADLQAVDDTAYFAVQSFLNVAKQDLLQAPESAIAAVGFFRAYQDSLYSIYKLDVQAYVEQKLIGELLARSKDDLFSQNILTSLIVKEGAMVKDLMADPKFYLDFLDLLGLFRSLNFNEYSSSDVESMKSLLAHIVEGEAVGFREMINYLRGQGVTLRYLNGKIQEEQNPWVKEYLATVGSLLAAQEGLLDETLPEEDRDYALKREILLSSHLKGYPKLLEFIFGTQNVRELFSHNQDPFQFIMEQRYVGKTRLPALPVGKTYAQILRDLNQENIFIGEKVLMAFDDSYEWVLFDLSRNPKDNRQAILLMNDFKNRELVLKRLVKFFKFFQNEMKQRGVTSLTDWQLDLGAPSEPAGIKLIGKTIYINVGDLIHRDMDDFTSDVKRTLDEGDHAMVVDTSRHLRSGKNDVGGIDLNPSQFDLKTQGPGIEFNLNFDPAMLENMNFTGFIPVIFEIIPVTNLPLLLGINLEESPGHSPHESAYGEGIWGRVTKPKYTAYLRIAKRRRQHNTQTL